MSDGQKSYNEMSDSEKKKEDWMNSKWRPAMGWLYMLVCLCDFVLFPVLWAVLHAVMHSTNVTQWQPLTLQGAGLFHLAMGAVLGLAAWGRTQEKLGGANNGGLATSSPMPTSSFGAPSTPSFSAPSTPSFSAPAPKPVSAPSFNAPTTPTFAPPATPMLSSTGKPMPVPADEPEL